MTITRISRGLRWRIHQMRPVRNLRRAAGTLGEQIGASIPELMIAMVISTLAVGLIAASAYQFLVATRDGNERMQVLQDLHNGSLWLGRDASEATSFTPGTEAVYGTFTLGDATQEYRYSYDASTTSLLREHLIGGEVQSTRKTARWIAAQGDVVFSVNGTLLTVSITSTCPGGNTFESMTLKLAMRVK